MSDSQKKRCKDCIHFVEGYSLTTQEIPIMVCDLRPKRIYSADYNGVRDRKYFYKTKPHGWCEQFSRKELQDE